MLLRSCLLIVLAAAFIVACSNDEPTGSSDRETVQQSQAQQVAAQSLDAEPAQSQQVAAQPQQTTDSPDETVEQSDPEQQAQQAQQTQQATPQGTTAAPSETDGSADTNEPTEPAASDQSASSSTDSPSSEPTAPSGSDPEPSFDFNIAVGYLEHLAETLGPRASGTDQERAAAEYLATAFRNLGYEAEIQEFGFTARVAYGRIDATDGHSSFAFWFPGSSKDAVNGELVNVGGYGELADFESVDVTGKVAVVDRGLIEFRAKAANAEAAGAIALIIANRTSVQSLGGTLGTSTSEIPILHVSKEAGDALRERLGTPVSIPEAPPNDGESQNVIARLPNGQCRIVVGGHYDTVPEVPGANDNASGTALTLAFAEVWADHPATVDICFVGFGAEELGLHGSDHFVATLQSSGEIEDVVAMLNLDAIGDGAAPYQIIASAPLRDLGRSVAEDLQIVTSSGVLPINLGSDHASFANAGIPVVFVFPPGAILHTPLDNMDNVDLGLFEDIARLNHGILTCVLEWAGSAVAPTYSCAADQP